MLLLYLQMTMCRGTTGPTKKDSISPGLLRWNLEQETCNASCHNLVSFMVVTINLLLLASQFLPPEIKCYFSII